jgi:16S rRNA (cytidine1402-2'-O)-methyltransferase
VKRRSKAKTEPAGETGRLFVVATPIGNLADITLRALKILAEVDVIAAEDTRRTLKLLNHYQISKPLVSYHSQNEAERAPELIRQLQAGKSMALVSDAGTPGFSDPGTALVAQAWDADIPVTAIPGPAAGLTALSMSGFAGDVTFIGFLPRQAKKRLEFIGQLAQERRVLIIYESPRRLLPTLQELSQIMEGRQVLIVRELTKLFEQCWRGPLASVAAELADQEIKGECTIVLSRPVAMAPEFRDVRAYLLETISGHPEKTGRALALEAAEILGISRREAYQAYLALKNENKLP